MHVRDHRLGQLEPGPAAATIADGAPGVPLASYYKLAVAAGLTVWLVSKLLDGTIFKKRRR